MKTNSGFPDGNFSYYPMEHLMSSNEIVKQNAQINQLQPFLSNNPTETTLTLFKELTGYQNYGNPSGNADILYRGNRGEWTFEVPQFFFIPGLLNAQLYIRAILDDKQPPTPLRQYSATISINDRVVHRGSLPLEHGRPYGQRFTNWNIMRFDVPNFRRINRVTIVNTSTGAENDWIGLDWMEMRFFRR